MKTLNDDPDMLAEYDFTDARRSHYAERYAKGPNDVVLVSDEESFGSDTPVRTLRQRYGADFLPEFRADAKLETVLKRIGAKSLSDLLKRRPRRGSTSSP